MGHCSSKSAQCRQTLSLTCSPGAQHKVGVTIRAAPDERGTCDEGVTRAVVKLCASEGMEMTSGKDTEPKGCAAYL